MEKSYKDRLVVHVTQIPEKGIDLKEEFPREWLINIPEYSDDTGTHIEGPIRISGRVVMEGDNLRVSGQAAADLATVCTRCGEPVVHPLRGDFDLRLIKGHESEISTELELTPEDFDRGYYDGIVVDLAPFFQEEIALQVPVQILCRPDCRGLCSHCGVNLNEKQCGCVQETGDPRLAVLKGLKIEK
jgi:uncharacterized protein